MQKEDYMKQLKWCAVITGILLFTIAVAVAWDINCPSCGLRMIWTGDTRTEWGQIFKLYRCPAGHTYWFKSQGLSPPQNDFSTGPKCPFCGANVIWTGETYFEWGKTYKVYKCPAGHISAGR